MNKRSKSINLFLIDGDVKGRIKCTIANWTGLVFKIPRIQVEASKNREELKQTGVYFLFGSTDDKEVDKDSVYIGQAGLRANGEGLLFRVNEHKNDVSKDYWNEAVMVTTSNNFFGPTEISYLENRLVMMAKDANRYDVKNNVNPNKGNITEEKNQNWKSL
ncbi:GIY-YIG nuclease family protein [Staphylococcus haemolyticus]|uniref:GIY-YIG nuclease family protein n=1 Tax=Staphylococcus haemolyticus TaxID=1283 RepID=UPI001F54233E|nr:GIY-YIG nuclease family protein [Staphylococcus haemolyticus]